MEDNSLVLLGKRVRNLRRQHGFSQARLAELCEISSRHLSEVERGASYPSQSGLLLKTVTALAAAGADARAGGCR